MTVGQVAIFVGKRYIVSVSRDGAGDHGALRSRLECLPEMFEVGVNYILHGLLSVAADSCIQVADGLDEEVGELEATIPEGSLDRSASRGCGRSAG